MSDIEEKLIKSVKQQACLYNKSNAGFRNRQKRDRAWAQVSMECGLPVKQSQCRWKTLRDRFVRECHKCSDSQMDSSHWRYFKQLHFLLEHIKPRGCGSLDDQQLDFEVDLSLDNGETNRSYSSDPHCKSEANGEDPLSEASSSTREHLPPPPLGLEQAQEEFLRVMGLLENVLAQKLPSDVPAADPFYKYLESILSRVEANERADIQLEILNYANQLVKNAKTQSAS